MSDRYRILVVEDEEDIAEFLAMEFEYEGYAVTTALDGREGLKLALEKSWDIILLDVMLPHMSGMEVCRRIRAVSQVPIIMLTARGSVPDRVAGLDAGADDYLQKPFAIEELLARIRVLLRRSHGPAHESPLLTCADLSLNPATREVERQGKSIHLTAREFDLLETFMRHPNQVLTRDQLLEQVWGYDYSGETNIVDVYVRYVRQKIDVPFDFPLIHTVRGVGYILKGSGGQ
ncbi:putative transcriptional regulatory protein YkoG [Alicyclobacillus contaminans]|uniref:response regulator transcription factor n=1 Tax=Alicyclobacillus contaminans TaxID=392016 RepID=UPI00041BAEEF|nr:response regulator transcription factor [Alicyclobacillus contaminans]GMA48744.1 putative transcriptional regulatory protein YkoG [Alicyclobacillus contaminans]